MERARTQIVGVAVIAAVERVPLVETNLSDLFTTSESDPFVS